MSVVITITGTDAAEAIKEVTSLASSFTAAPAAAVEAPKAGKPKAEKPKPEPKAEPAPKAETPKAEPEKPKPAASPLPKDGSPDREKFLKSFLEAAQTSYEAKAAELATFPVEDQYAVLRQCGIELMQSGHGEEFKAAGIKAGFSNLKAISTDSAKMLPHFKTLIDLLSV